MANKCTSSLARLSTTTFMAVLLMLAIAGCGGGTPSPATNTNGVVWKSDGIVTDGEYLSTKVISDTFTLWWNSDFTYIYVAMKGTSPITAGYVSIGILPSNWTPDMQKMNAEAIIGFVVGGKATVVDTYFTGPIGPHPIDGKNNIEMPSGSVNGNTTIIEFRRKLNTGDSHDQPLVKGINKIMWAVGFDATDTASHAARGYSEIEIK